MPTSSTHNNNYFGRDLSNTPLYLVSPDRSARITAEHIMSSWPAEARHTQNWSCLEVAGASCHTALGEIRRDRKSSAAACVHCRISSILLNEKEYVRNQHTEWGLENQAKGSECAALHIVPALKQFQALQAVEA